MADNSDDRHVRNKFNNISKRLRLSSLQGTKTHEKFKEKNRRAKKKYLSKLVKMKVEQHAQFNSIQQKRNNSRNKYQRRKRMKTPIQKLKRYRKILKLLGSDYFDPMEDFMIPEDGQNIFIKNNYEFNDWVSLALSLLQQDKDAKSLHFMETLSEFVCCQIENKFYHPSKLMQQTSIWFRGGLKALWIPISKETSDLAASQTILLDGNKLYYWTFSQLVTDQSIIYELIYTKKSCPKNYPTKYLEEFLQIYDLKIHELKKLQ